ncbi:universal stress protein [Staphylococcus saprophyticus]|uniref:universal stress protein n=1 Tax=Staphylococcus saprophyticus TaxID=29385 RepID=UPI0021B1EFC6|nr:universal stress protein [Staphylococcus saprophyticus]
MIEELEGVDLSVRVKFRGGYIKEGILSEVKENGYDIMVMSNRGEKCDMKNILGKVTEKIGSNVEIGVLIVN